MQFFHDFFISKISSLCTACKLSFNSIIVRNFAPLLYEHYSPVFHLSKDLLRDIEYKGNDEKESE